ncbi:hypothetical protein J7M00_02815 [bacterium]|nr:hypothetical protein [bacterium]
MRKAKRRRGPSTRLGRRSPIILAVALLACITIAIALASNAIGFAMYRVGDAFIAWIAVELNGKLYPPNAGEGLSWKFWVDPDHCPPEEIGTITVTTTVSGGGLVGRGGGAQTYTTTLRGCGGPPRRYPKPGSPECGGTADLNIRSVKGGGLYVTDSGFLVQVIEVKGQWVDTSYQVKCYGNNWCSRPCGEKIGDAWIYVILDEKKLKGGMPIYIEVSDKSVKEWLEFAESETKVIQKLKWEAEQGDQNAVQIRWLGHIEGGELQQQVPFLWFPDNSTLKFKLTGLMKVMQDYGALYRPIHYYVYIAPPGNKVFKDVVKTITLKTRKYYRGHCPEYPWKAEGWRLVDKIIVEREGPTPVRYKCIYVKTTTKHVYKLVEAESTPETVTTTMTRIVVENDTVKTETYEATLTVNKIVEETIDPEKTPSVTVAAPKATYVVADPRQAERVAEAYQPPKPLIEIIYEKLLEFYQWLLKVLGLR